MKIALTVMAVILLLGGCNHIKPVTMSYNESEVIRLVLQGNTKMFLAVSDISPEHLKIILEANAAAWEVLRRTRRDLPTFEEMLVTDETNNAPAVKASSPTM